MKKFFILLLMAFCLQVSAQEMMSNGNSVPAVLKATSIKHISAGLRGDYLIAKFLVYDGKKDNSVQMFLTVTLKEMRKQGTLKLVNHHLQAKCKEGEATVVLNNQNFEQVIFDSSTKKLWCNLDGAIRVHASTGSYSIPVKFKFDLNYKRL